MNVSWTATTRVHVHESSRLYFVTIWKTALMLCCKVFIVNHKYRTRLIWIAIQVEGVDDLSGQEPRYFQTILLIDRLLIAAVVATDVEIWLSGTCEACCNNRSLMSDVETWSFSFYLATVVCFQLSPASLLMSTLLAFQLFENTKQVLKSRLMATYMKSWCFRAV